MDNGTALAAARAIRAGLERLTQLATRVEELQQTADRMRSRLWDNAAYAMYTGDMRRYTDRVDLLFAMDHNGHDMHDPQYTNEDRETYRTTTQTDIINQLNRLFPGWENNPSRTTQQEGTPHA